MPVAMKIAAAVAAALTLGADATTLCGNATGVERGYFHSVWHDGGTGCLTLGPGGDYRVRWQLGKQGNLVAGRGWATGAVDRVVHYTARAFVPGANGYLALYGWSTDPLVEYYVVDDWGGFTPPGPEAVALGQVVSDGGTYRLYRTRRVGQPSIAGTATFDQYWSVRTERRRDPGRRAITFARHVAAWRGAGMRLGRLGYQILATEGFGSTGRSDIGVADR